jgi:hypothetical protein
MFPEISIKFHPSCQSAFGQVPSIRIHYLCRFLSFICADCAKFVARLPKILLVLVIMDLWRNGMKGDIQLAIVTPQTGVEDVGGDSHFVIS